MARSPERLIGTAVLAVSAILFMPALLDALGAVSFNQTQFGQYLEPLLSRMPLLLALFALVVIAAFILDQ